MVTTLDFTPTILEATKLPAIPNIDGRSFLPALKGEKMTGWDHVFTVYNSAFGNNWLPMRCMRTRDHSYIWNAWSNGTKKYQTENMAGLTWDAMTAAAKKNPAIKERTEFYTHRTPEEFYNLNNDPYERNNLIKSADSQAEIESMRKQLLTMMQSTDDPFANAFANRDNKELIQEAIKKQQKAP
jgi:N-sulfoglucosamine sulfohydrolase